MDEDRSMVELALGPVSIIWLETDPGPCACGCEIGVGPVGFRLEPREPVCDKCLLDLHKDIGMMLWMTHIARELAAQATGIDDPWRADQFMVALMAFAGLYNAEAGWPSREAAAMDFMEELKERMAVVPWDALRETLVGPVQ